MYYCQVMKKMSKPGEKLNRLVVETRERSYKAKVFNEELRKYEELVVGQGWEIVKEIDACDEGAAIWETLSPEDKKRFSASLV